LPTGTPFGVSLPHLVIQSDAFNTGWGAVSNGVDTRRTWTRQETSLHIDCKELLAASFAGKAFTKTLQNAHVLIEMDNTTTIAYINKIGPGVKGAYSITMQDICVVGDSKKEQL